MSRPVAELRLMDAEQLLQFVTDNVEVMSEEQTLAVLANRFCNARVCQLLAQAPRLTSHYAVRRKLVAHRATPQSHAVKFVHYLFLPDLIRLSTDVQVPAAVRRSMDVQLLNRITKLTLGEKITTARTCSRDVAKALFSDPDPRVFAGLLNNARVSEDDVLATVNAGRCTPDQLRLVGDSRKWSFRTAVRKALLLNPLTPRALAASQLRHLATRELESLSRNPSLSLYLLRCLERLLEDRGDQQRRPAAANSLQ